MELDAIGTPTTCPVAFIMRDGKVLLGLRHYTPDKWKEISVWTCPGGRCDSGETVEETLRREIVEETDITELNDLRFLAEVPGAKEGDVVPLFMCNTSQEPQLMEPEKFSAWEWFRVEDIPENFINEHARDIILKLLIA